MAKTQTHQIGEHTYITPSIPNKKDILFSDKPKEEQFWLREQYPQLFLDYIPQYTEFDREATQYDDEGLLKSLSQEDSRLVYDLLLQERDRRRNGVWFMNNGEITYMTGSHYFMLQWCKLYAVNANINYKNWQTIFGIKLGFDEFNLKYADYGRYMEFQRDIFYLLDLVDNDDECAGIFLTKAKKTGVTMMIGCHLLNLGIMNKNKQLAIMSKTSEAAIETNFLYIYHAFMGLPKAMQPMYSNLPKASGEIFFGAKIFRGNNKKQKALSQMEQDTALNTKINCVPTKIKAFDAPVVFRAYVDEPTKIFADSKISVRQLFDTTLATIKFQQTITGKTYWACYVSEDNDSGVDESRNIYFDSKLKTRKNGSKRTKSEMYCHHVSALYSYISLIDKFGKCDEKEANTQIQEAIDKSKGDPRTFQSMKRQNARTESEAWMAGGQRSLFNPVTLGKRIEDIEDYKRNSATPVGVYGYLKWDNPLWELGKKNRRPLGKISNVIFVPLTEDEILAGAQHKLTIYRRLDPSQLNLPLKLGKDDKGNYIAPERFRLVGGVDPVNYASDVIEGSKIASYTMNLHDEGLNTKNNRVESKVIVSEFFYRSDNPDENYEDILKEIVFFGRLSVVEGNTTYVATKLIKEGFANYLVFKNQETKTLCLNKPYFVFGEDTVLVRRTANADSDDLMAYMMRVCMDYLEIIEGEPNYLEQIWDIILLKQAVIFDPKETKKFDKVMAFAYCLVCYDVYMNHLLEGQDNEYEDIRNIAAILNGLQATG